MAIYYVKNGGNDTLDGLSDSNAWATIAEVNEHTYNPGDSILFKCGSTWRLSSNWDISQIGSVGNNITFGSYDSGNKPRLLGSGTTIWSNYSGNVWVSDSTFNSLSTATVIFEELDDTYTWGIAETSIINLTVEYEYFWNSGDNKVYIYCTSDPDSVYHSVEIPQVESIIEIQTTSYGGEYLTFNGFEIAYCTNTGIRSEWPGGKNGVGDPLRGIIIRNCWIHHLGQQDGDGYGIGCNFSDMLIEDNEIHDSGRRNISIMIDSSYYSDSLENIIVQNNYLHTGWHTTGMDIFNLHPSKTISDVTFKNNLIDDEDTPMNPADGSGSNGMHIAVQGAGTGVIEDIHVECNIFRYTKGDVLWLGKVTNLYIYNNVFYGTNSGVPAWQPLIYSGDSDAYYVYIKNNIFVITKTNDGVFNLGTKTNWNLDYNLYYTSLGDVYMWQMGSSYTYSQWTNYKSGTGFDTNSPTPDNPDFVSDEDFHLQLGSPAITEGVWLDITYDYEGNNWKNPPSIGVYEYGSSSCPVITNMNPMIHAIHVNS